MTGARYEDSFIVVVVVVLVVDVVIVFVVGRPGFLALLKREALEVS
jgi:hypothetical protein